MPDLDGLLDHARFLLTQARRARFAHRILWPRMSLQWVFTWSWLAASTCVVIGVLTTPDGPTQLSPLPELLVLVTLVLGTALVALPVHVALAWRLPQPGPVRSHARGLLELALLDVEQALDDRQVDWDGFEPPLLEARLEELELDLDAVSSAWDRYRSQASRKVVARSR